MTIAGIDFGTTNSTAGFADAQLQEAYMVNLSADAAPVRSVLFADDSDGKMYTGDAAMKLLIEGGEGRFMQSLKKYLGEPQLLETRVARATYTLEDLISFMLRDFKEKLEAAAEEDVDTAILGRPVRFNDDDTKLDLEAQNRLYRAAKKAGFKHLSFQFEPIAAAIGYESKLEQDELVLVVDVGGGTTDFSLIHVGPNKNKYDRSNDVLAYNGVYVGGDLFDSAITLNTVAPHMGRDATFKSMGEQLPWPVYIFESMASWAFFNQLYDTQTRKDITDMHRYSSNKEQTARLVELIDAHLYFEFSTAVEAAKRRLSDAEETAVDMGFFDAPFSAPLTRADFEAMTTDLRGRIETAMLENLKKAQVSTNQVDKVFLTGGTTLIPSVRQLFAQHFGAQKLVQTDVFTSVGYGLVTEALTRG